MRKTLAIFLFIIGCSTDAEISSVDQEIGGLCNDSCTSSVDCGGSGLCRICAGMPGSGVGHCLTATPLQLPMGTVELEPADQLRITPTGVALCSERCQSDDECAIACGHCARFPGAAYGTCLTAFP